MSGADWVLLLSGACIYIGLLMTWAIRRAKRNYPAWIVPQLQKRGRVKLAIRSSGGTWNPARTTIGGRLYVSGQATYTLDDAGVIHLRIEPKKGSEQNFSGPLPEPTQPSPRVQRLRRTRRTVTVVFVGTLAVGFLIGFVVSGGATASRLGWGLFGLGVAWLIVWFGLLVVRVFVSVKKVHSNSL